MLARVKDLDSAYEKIDRKGYKQPFEQIEDWCGLRIICYYPSDIDLICAVLKEEFSIQKQEDTAQRLAPHEFGYRSTHFILQVKSDWTSTPNYRGLLGIKAEVQVRTILMHAWAEIEHKLSYKSAEQVPDQFRRKLYRLSAKFEEADEQFEELRDGITNYRKNIRETVKNASAFRTQDLNLDTLQAFLDKAFPDAKRKTQPANDLLDELASLNMNLKDVVNAWEIAKGSLANLQKSESPIVEPLAQVGLLRLALDIGCDKYYELRKSKSPIYKDSSHNLWSKAVAKERASLIKSIQNS